MVLAKGKVQMEEIRLDLSRHRLPLICLELVLTFITCATQMLEVNPTVCFISYLTQNSSALFVFNIVPSVHVSRYELLHEVFTCLCQICRCEFSLGFANNVDPWVKRGLHHFIDHLAICNLRAGSEIERFHFEEYLMNFRNNFQN